jgi:serine/threonine protein kinase
MLQGPTARSGSGGLPRVFGSVVLLRSLSRDPRTEVFLALRAEGADRLCVVNFLGTSVTSSPRVIDALRAQATWLVSRVHGNLVQIYDVGQSGEQLFFVSEYVEGADLSALLGRTGPLGVGMATHIALEVGEALAFARGQEEASTGVRTQIVGLSASSVMLARDGKVKLLHPGSGLGLSTEVPAARGSAPTSLVPPEDLSGASPAGDVYAVGALLWQMLTGRPLGGVDGAAHLAELRAGRFRPRSPASVTGAQRNIPGALNRLVLAALSPRPEDRPQDFQAFRSDLVPLMRTLPDTDERAVRRLVVDNFSGELTANATELARLTAAACRPIETGPQPPALTLANISGVRRRRPAEIELSPGHTIPGTRYRALEKLGEGGMGAVYLAEHVDIERKVALKLLHSDLVQNPLVLRQFRQEARAASRIGNPYICDVTDWGEVEDGRVFFVMEYLDGASLGTVLKEEHRFSPARTIPIVRQVAKALGAAHEKGIVHLDVKPDNVILLRKDNREDSVKVVDFGIAGLLGQGSSGGKVMGTPEYMAPERAQGLGYDHRSDIYSLGVMAYEMLVGEVPLQGSAAVETLAMQVDEQPDRINERLIEPIPEKIEALMMRMLEKDPARRPQNMAEVEARLIEAQLEARIQTPWDDELTLPPMDPDRAARLARRLSPQPRNARLYLAVASSVAALSATLAIFFATRDSESVSGSTARLGILERARIGSPAVAASAPNQSTAPSPPVPAPVVPGAIPPRQASAAVATPSPLPAAPEPRLPTGQIHSPTGTVTSPDGSTVAARFTVADPDPSRGPGRRPPIPPPARDPRQALIYINRGTAALTAGRAAQAEVEFKGAVNADPQNPEGFVGLADSQFENANYRASLLSAKRAIKLRYPGFKPHVIAGHAHMKRNEYRQAVQAYSEAARIAPYDSSIQEYIVRARSKLSNTPEGGSTVQP